MVNNVKQSLLLYTSTYTQVLCEINTHLAWLQHENSNYTPLSLYVLICISASEYSSYHRKRDSTSGEMKKSELSALI